MIRRPWTDSNKVLSGSPVAVFAIHDPDSKAIADDLGFPAVGPDPSFCNTTRGILGSLSWSNIELPGSRSSPGDEPDGRVCPIYEIKRPEINLNSVTLD